MRTSWSSLAPITCSIVWGESRILDLISSVCPHGVAWASDVQTRESARTTGTALVEAALRSEGLKPEHARVHVGFVVPVDL